MTKRQLYDMLDSRWPRSLSCSWDNDGIMVSDDPDTEVGKILVALDATESTLLYAAHNGYDTVVVHHPMLFRGVKSVTDETNGGRRVIISIIAGITVISLHTRLDAGENGVNDTLCRRLGFEPTESFGDEDSPTLCKIANVPEMTVGELASLAKERLGCPMVRINGKREIPVRRIAFCGGDGKSFISEAHRRGCNAYITGDAGYNAAGDEGEMGMVTIEVGHYHSEAPVCAVLCDAVEDITGIRPDFYDSCTYTVI